MELLTGVVRSHNDPATDVPVTISLEGPRGTDDWRARIEAATDLPAWPDRELVLLVLSDGDEGIAEVESTGHRSASLRGVCCWLQ